MSSGGRRYRRICRVGKQKSDNASDQKPHSSAFAFKTKFADIMLRGYCSTRLLAKTAILPCNNLDASEGFYAKLGIARSGGNAVAFSEPDETHVRVGWPCELGNKAE
jgi:hypothetical protein